MRGRRWEPITRAALVLAAALGSPSHAAHAQPSAPKSRFATVVGVVDDSLRRGPLVGATVVVLGTTRQTVTNAQGVFRLDSIEPGEHRIGVRHPLLDTLALGVLSSPIQMAAGQQLDLAVHTASLESLHERACPRSGVVLGASMLFGRVLEADTDAPISDATLSLVYHDASSPDARSRVRQAKAQPDGSFAICGLPDNIVGTIEAQRNGRSTADLPIVLKDDLLATAILTFSASSESVSVLQGRVTNKGGQPVEGAQVAVTGTSTVGLTRADGSFALTGLPAGTVEAVVRKIGFAQQTRVVALTKRAPRRITVTLNPAQLLATVRVEGKLDLGLQKAGFTDRKRSANGQFITPEEIDRRKPLLFSDMMQTVSGFRVVPTASGRVIQSTRSVGGSGNCLNVFIDRSQFQVMEAGDLDLALVTSNLGAIEAYPSGSSAPAEFQVAGKSCATLVVWTKTKLGLP